MRLSVEFQSEQEELDIICDQDGLDSFIRTRIRLREHGTHAHMMTPSWAGNELTEERHTENGVLINHLRIVLLGRGETVGDTDEGEVGQTPLT
jgi:hypothetical protein